MTISTSACSRVMKPCITMEVCGRLRAAPAPSRARSHAVGLQLTLSDGRVRTFEVPLSQFHRLRHAVARALRDVSDVESHPIMRLAFEAGVDLDDE